MFTIIKLTVFWSIVFFIFCFIKAPVLFAVTFKIFGFGAFAQPMAYIFVGITAIFVVMFLVSKLISKGAK